jgi:hypothetical protein
VAVSLIKEDEKNFASNTSGEGTCAESSFERIHLHYEKTYCFDPGASSGSHVSDFLHYCGEGACNGDHDHDA